MPTANFRDLQDRYFQDPQFHKLVDYMYHIMVAEKVPPYEIRDAAYMAGIKFAQLNVEPAFIIDNFTDKNKRELMELLNSMHIPNEEISARLNNLKD